MPILKSTYTEASEILHNAREALMNGEITEEQYNEIKQATFDACADNVNLAQLFTPEVEIE